MRSIRKFAYAVFLSMSLFAVQPSLAAAEDFRGSFTLPREVRLQDNILPPREYSFSLRPSGPAEILVLQSLGKTPFSAMVMVGGVDQPKPDDLSRLVLVSRNGQTYVSALNLPQYDMVLHFRPPREQKRGRW